MTGSDPELIRQIYEEYYRPHPDYRHQSCWILSQPTLDDLESILVPSPEDPDEHPDDGRPRTERPYLLGLPVEIREGAEGIRLERNESSWGCLTSGKVGWHEQGCPHVPWDGVETVPILPGLPESLTENEGT